MKKRLVFFFIVLVIKWQPACCQALYIDSTRFITGDNPSTGINYAIPTADKGILFAGYSTYNPGGIIPSFPYGNSNVLVGKIDSNQQISWLKVYGGGDEDGAGPSCQTPDGGYAVLAGTGSNNGDVTGFKGATDIWLLRLDGAGNLLWQKTYGSSQSDGPISIANTPDHGFIILGTTNGSDGDVPFHYGGFFSMDWLVIKTDSMGNVQWSKNMGTSLNDGVDGSILAIDSSYYLISSAQSKDHDCTDTAWHSGINTGADIYILKLDNAGNITWNKSYGGSQVENANHAMFDAGDGTIVIAGYTHSNDYMVTGHQGGGDMWVLKVSKTGTLVWQKTLGSVNEDKVTGICISHSGGYMVYGSTRYAIGGGDGWIFSLDNGGSEITNKVIGGTDNEQPNSIVPYLNGYAATGFSLSTVFTEGTTYGRHSNGAYISYIDFWPLGVNTTDLPPNRLSCYPNPTTSNTNVLLPDNAGSLTIVNTIGQIIYEQKINYGAKHLDINTGNWVNGLYCVIWRSETGAVYSTNVIKY